MALHNRAFGNTVVHSENGRFVVMITAAFSALPAITWNSISAPASARATYPISSITNSSYRVQRAVTRLSSLFCLASTSSPQDVWTEFHRALEHRAQLPPQQS